MYLWVAARGKIWVAIRRSLWFKGTIPHFSIFRNKGMWCLHVEYIPNRRKGEPRTSDDLLLLFPGVYRATLFKRVASVTSKDYEEAVRGVFGKMGHSIRGKK